MIVKVAKEKFPEFAGQAQAKAMEWAKDPAVQAKAKEYGMAALGQASAALGASGEALLGQIEQGPTGVRILAFGASAMSCVCAVLFLINIGHVGVIAIYVVCIYQLIFALTSIVFEAPPSIIEKVPGVTAYQDIIIDKVKGIS